MPPSPNSELLSQTAARQLLERAGQIDSDSTSVETLRAAAREAGISDAAFEAALTEMRGQMAVQARPAPPRSRMRLILSIGAAAVIMAAAAVFVVIPGGASVARTQMLDHEIEAKCLPMKMAQKIAQTLLKDEGNEVQMSQGSRFLRVRATAAQVKTLEATFQSTAKRLDFCDNSPP